MAWHDVIKNYNKEKNVLTLSGEEYSVRIYHGKMVSDISALLIVEVDSANRNTILTYREILFHLEDKGIIVKERLIFYTYEQLIVVSLKTHEKKCCPLTGYFGDMPLGVYETKGGIFLCGEEYVMMFDTDTLEQKWIFSAKDLFTRPTKKVDEPNLEFMEDGISLRKSRNMM
jgi:hypothetical protein